MVSTRSVAVAPSGRSPLSLKPTTRGISIETGWPSIAASASMPPTPQPTTPMPLTIVVCESVPTSVSGYAVSSAVDLTGEHHAGEVLDVDLVDDAGAGRDDLEVVERALAPAQELVALPVALVLDLDVALERLGRAEHVGDHRVVDDHLGRSERVDPRRVATEVLHRLAHGGEVDDARHAGEVLHDHARRRELDLLVGLGVRVPAGERLDVVGGDVRAVLGAQQVLQQHLQAERQRLDVEAVTLDRVESVDLVGLAVDVQRALGTEAVRRSPWFSSSLGVSSAVSVPHLAHRRRVMGSRDVVPDISLNIS